MISIKEILNLKMGNSFRLDNFDTLKEIDDNFNKFDKTLDNFSKTVDEFGKTVDNIEFNLFREDLNEYFDNNDIDKLEKYDNMRGYCNLFVDTSLEEGNVEMTKLLINKFKCEPSLYSKQMAHINGHHKLVFWTEAYGKQRNDTDIKSIHYNYKTNTWHDCIPEEFRY
jgi:hypothetical protein